MRRAWVPILIGFAAILPAHGALITGTSSSTGTVNVLSSAPVSTVSLQSNTVIDIFSEGSFHLTAPLAVDVLSSGAGPYSIVTPGMLPTGTNFSSFYLHVNPVNGSLTGPIINYVGSVTFNSNILGLILLDASLSATDGTIGVPGTTYNPAPMQGLELSGPLLDQFTVSGNTLFFNLQSREFSDNIRILAADPAPVPEPSTAFMILPGLGLLAFGAWRRRSTR